MSDELEARACSGCLDLPQENAVEWHEARVAGWALPPDQIKHIEIFVDKHCVGVMKLGESKRPDLSSAFPHVPGAESGGFDGIVSLGGKEGPCEIVVNALMSDETTVKIAQRIIMNSLSAIDRYQRDYMLQFMPFRPHPNIWRRLVKKKSIPL